MFPQKITMNYQWINPEEIKFAVNSKIILFGAGKGSEEFFHFVKEKNLDVTVTAVADNDFSLWGKYLNEVEIIPPSTIAGRDYDRIAVTSISGRETISRQLEEIGAIHGRDFICIGRYPLAYQENFNRLRQWIPLQKYLPGCRCLHVGPGGFLGLEALLFASGAQQVIAIDKFAFGIRFPEISKQLPDYQEAGAFLDGISKEENVMDSSSRLRFNKLFIHQNQDSYINKKSISYHYPVDVEDLPFADNTFDLVLSFAVLEHVHSPKRTISELMRVTKKDGLNFHRIMTTDHRSFSKIDGYHHFSFRKYSPDEWKTLSGQKFYQNRLLPCQWKEMFEKSGCHTIRYEEEYQVPLLKKDVTNFHPDFQSFTFEELSAVNCILLSQKTNE